jgi:hypothetical protein
MPEQTTFFEQQTGDRRIVVLKSYDRAFAREGFDQMQPEALRFLGRFLELDSKYEPAEIPTPEGEDYAEALWEEIQEGARENWNTFSYFIVCEEADGQSLPLFVSADWPSAEAFAKWRLAR